MPSIDNDISTRQVEPHLSRFASLLLAAGHGTRLKPLTDSIPKPALYLLDAPLAAFGLVDLASLTNPVIVNLSVRSDLVERVLSPFAPNVCFVVEEPEPFGTAGTLASLKERFDGPVVTRNADLLSDVALPAVLRTHQAGGRLATIVTTEVDSHADLVIEGDRAMRLVDRRVEDVAGHLWLGIAVWERAALDLIGPTRPLDLASGLLAGLVDKGEVNIHHHDGYALDVGTIDRYLTANLDLLYGRVPSMPPGSVIEVDGGRAYLGPGARAAKGSLGPGAILLAGADVGAGSRLERAVIWPHESVPSGTTVADAVWAFGRAHAAGSSG